MLSSEGKSEAQYHWRDSFRAEFRTKKVWRESQWPFLYASANVVHSVQKRSAPTRKSGKLQNYLAHALYRQEKQSVMRNKNVGIKKRKRSLRVSSWSISNIFCCRACLPAAFHKRSSVRFWIRPQKRDFNFRRSDSCEYVFNFLLWAILWTRQTTCDTAYWWGGQCWRLLTI